MPRAPVVYAPPALQGSSSTSSRPGGADETLAYADLVLRCLAAEFDDIAVERLRVRAFTARIECVQPVRVGAGSVFEAQPDGGLVLPRTRRALEALVESATHPLPALVPFVSAASSDSVTMVAAPEIGRLVSAVVARRAAELHWLAPWCHEVVSVAAELGPPCQVPLGSVSSAEMCPGRFLVFAGASQEVDLDPLPPGCAVGVLRYPDGSFAETTDTALRAFCVATPPSFGTVEYVLVDEFC